MVTRIYIVRHCEAEGNVTGVFQGKTDFDISEKGKKQLKKLAERFKDIKLDVVYSSPLKRAFLTAEAVIEHKSLAITIDERLSEIDGGDMEGKPWSNLDVLFPNEYYFWKNDFSKFYPTNGESVSDVYNRISEAFDEIVDLNRGKAIGIFSHGCAIRILMCYIKGIPLERIEEVLWSDNTAITCVEVNEAGEKTIVYENDYVHIMNDYETKANRMWWGEQKN